MSIRQGQTQLTTGNVLATVPLLKQVAENISEYQKMKMKRTEIINKKNDGMRYEMHAMICNIQCNFYYTTTDTPDNEKKNVTYAHKVEAGTPLGRNKRNGDLPSPRTNIRHRSGTGWVHMGMPLPWKQKTWVFITVTSHGHQCPHKSHGAQKKSTLFVGFCCRIMTSRRGNAFRDTDPLWGESTGHWWIPLIKDL